MNIINKILKAKITRTSDKLTFKVFPMVAIMLLYALVCISLLGLLIFTYSGNVVAPFFFLAVVFAYSFGMVNWLIYKVHSYNLEITGNELEQAILPKAPKFSNAILKAPFFIDIFVTTTGDNIKVLIENQGQKLGLFRLASANDLSVIIDGLVELLDLELVDSYKLSNKELLSFQSKQKRIAPYSAVQILELKNNLTIRSVTEQINQLEFDFRTRQIKKGRESEELSNIQKILIVSYKAHNQVAIELKSGEKQVIFKTKSSEITAIRDAQRLKNILEEQAGLGEIEVKTVDGKN